MVLVQIFRNIIRSGLLWKFDISPGIWSNILKDDISQISACKQTNNNLWKYPRSRRCSPLTFCNPHCKHRHCSIYVVSDATMCELLNLICHILKMKGEGCVLPKVCVCVSLYRRCAVYAWRCSNHGRGALPAPLPKTIQVVLFHTFFRLAKVFSR